MSNRVTHFEIPSDNPEKNMKFYKEVFDWTFKQFGQEQYWYAISGDERTPGINGAVMKRVERGQPVTNNISVANIDEAIRRIEKAGGKIVKSKMVIASVG